MAAPGQFTERWTFEIAPERIFRARPSFFDMRPVLEHLAQERAAELGLRLVGVVGGEIDIDYETITYVAAVTVVLEDHGDAPLIEGEVVDVTGQPLIPEIKKLPSS